MAQTQVRPPGNGTPASPYLISEPEHIMWMSLNQNPHNHATNPGWWVNNTTLVHFRQTEDIDMSEIQEDWDFVPIGQQANIHGVNTRHFVGVYDGGGFVIENLNIDVRGGHSFAGFFGMVSGVNVNTRSVVKNLGLVNVIVYSEAARGNNAYAGGIAAITRFVDIENCFVDARSNDAIHASYSAGWTETAHGFAGGLIGEARDTNIRRCFSNANVIAIARGVGLSSTSYSIVGGLVGRTNVGPVTIEDSYSLGTVRAQTRTGDAGASNGIWAGGIVGQMINRTDGIERCYSAAIITAGPGHASVLNIGGIVGYSQRTDHTIRHNNWLRRIGDPNTPTRHVGNRTDSVFPINTGLSEFQMRDINSYQQPPYSWNFTVTWYIIPTVNYGYPGLRVLALNPVTLNSPANNTNITNQISNLSWTAGLGNKPTSYEIRHGTTNPPPIHSPNFTGTSLNIAGLEANQRYFWSITPKNDYSAFLHDPIIRSYTTSLPPGPATSPFPSHGFNISELVSSVSLSWTPPVMTGTAVQPVISYDIYFGTTNPPPMIVSYHTTTSHTELVNHSQTYFWRVVPRNSIGETPLENTTVWTFGTHISPFTVINPTPIMGETVDVDVALSWEVGENSPIPTGYKIFLGTTEPLTEVANVHTTNWQPESPLMPSTHYFWRVVPYNSVGESTSNTTWNFTTRAVPLGATNPIPSDNAMLSTNSVTMLRWTAPVMSHNNGFRVYFDTVDPPVKLLSDNVRDTWIEQTEPIEWNTRYYWRVVPFDVNGEASLTDTPVWSFIAEPPAPGSVNVIYPSTVPGTIVLDLERPFEWSTVQGGDVDVAGYRVYLGESDQPTLREDIINTGVITTWLPNPPLEYGRKYFWKIVPYSSEGGSPDNIPIWEFETPLPPPYTARLISPLDSATNVRIDIDLMWAAATGGTAPAGYRLYMGTDPASLTFTDNGQSTFTSWSPNPLLSYSTEYFWKVVPHTIAGDAKDSPIWNFTTMAPPPLPATIVSPIHNATNQTLDISLSWKPNDTGTQPTSYRVLIGTSPETMAEVYNGPNHTANLAILTHGTTYYWQVIPRSLAGNAINCPIWSFSTIPPIPNPAVLDFPENGATKIDTDNITLSWNPSVDGGVPTGYTLYFGVDPQNLSVSYNGSNTTWVIPITLEYSTPYFWRVVPFNTTGPAVSENCPIWSFMTIADPTVSDDDVIIAITETNLLQNFPNPFNPETTIKFEIGNGKLENVRIEIYNLRGQHVRSLVNGVYTAGEHRVVWNGRDDYGRNVSSGIYLYVMKTDDYQAVRKMLLMK
jgi:hypothetical protein